MSRKHDIVTISGNVLQESDRAYLFTDGSKLKNPNGGPSLLPAACWLPKSQCEWDSETGEMQLPEWLALEKGLI